MRLVAVTALLFGISVAYSGWLGYTASGGLASLIGGLLSGGLLAALGVGSLKQVKAGYGAGVLTFLLCVYFAYRMITTERVVPSGLFLVIGFLALFLILLGVFLSLRQEE